MSRPTPETDAVSEDIGEVMGCMMVDKEFAQKLERERNEANALILATYYALTPDGCDLPPSGINSMPDKVSAILAERDEAREVLKRIANLSMNARRVEADYAEWEKAVFAILDLCEERKEK